MSKKQPKHSIEELIIIEMYQQRAFPYSLNTKPFVEWQVNSKGNPLLDMLRKVTRAEEQIDRNEVQLPAMEVPTELIHPLSI